MGSNPNQLLSRTQQLLYSRSVGLPADISFAFNANYYQQVNFIGPTAPTVPESFPALCADMRHVVFTLNRHEELLQEIAETVRVIEVETRRLNPDAIHALTDAAESGLNDILHTIQEGRFPSPSSPEIDALLSQAIERKRSLPPTAPSSNEELTTR
jgi:hypothetical protein